MSSFTLQLSAPRARIAVVGAVTAAVTVAAMAPADAAFKSSSIAYTGDKSVSCANGKYGFLYAEGNHVSYKKVHWKQNGVTTGRTPSGPDSTVVTCW